MSSADYYLKIDTIEGESDAVGFEKQMQIESFSFGASNSGSSGTGTGLGVGKVSMQDFHFVVSNGKASPQLFLACAKGNHIGQAILSCRKTGGDGNPFTYSKFTFGDIVISSFQTGGSNGSNVLPMEQIAFNFTNITIEYFQQKADGTVALTNTVSYDIKRVEGTGA
jgi:type VI secretion system secreted protein Hcp